MHVDIYGIYSTACRTKRTPTGGIQRTNVGCSNLTPIGTTFHNLVQWETFSPSTKLWFEMTKISKSCGRLSSCFTVLGLTRVHLMSDR